MVLLGFCAARERAAAEEHTRPVALALDARGDWLYVALSSADRVVAVDVSGARPSVVWDVPVCRRPTALAALPLGSGGGGADGGGVVVSCRFDPVLWVLTRAGSMRGVRQIWAGPEHGHRGVVVDPSGRFAFVASAARGGVKTVSLSPRPDEARPSILFRATGLGPNVLRVVPADLARSGARMASASSGRQWLLVANQIGHTVTVHSLADDGAVSPALQTIVTEAPVLDFQVTADALLLLTYEDRPLSRVHRDVEGLDSVVLRLPRHRGGSSLAFDDSGPGRRQSLNLTEHSGAGTPVVALESVATFGDGSAEARHIAISGAGSDNVWLAGGLPAQAPPSGVRVVPVGANPVALAFLRDGRLVTADRLSDTLTFLDVRPGDDSTGGRAPRVTQLAVGNLRRSTPAELGELLFFSRALVPNNVAEGPLSIYTCAACHLDGHIDGRRHPSKFNRFFSMTKTCRGLAGTEPFLSLGTPATLAGFADNIVGTHAQGAESAPDTFDRYDVNLRLPARNAARGAGPTTGEGEGGAKAEAHAEADAGAEDEDDAADGGRIGWTERRLDAAAFRSALAAFMATGMPVEPSPFVQPGRVRLTAPERRGLREFRSNCAGCHRLARSTHATSPVAESSLERALLTGQVALTAAGRFDVGTPVLGKGGNNPPSLHGVWAAAPYFSDGSAATLEDVLARTDPQAAKVHARANAQAAHPGLSPRAQADLLAFLRAL